MGAVGAGSPAMSIRLLDAAERVDQLVRQLLIEVADVMGQILERDAAIALKEQRTYTARQLRVGRRETSERL